MENNKIKNIVFDLGGVLIGLNKSRCLEAFKKIGLDRVSSDISHFSQSGLFRQLENGTIDPEIFYQTLSDEMGVAFSGVQFDRAWNLFLDDEVPPIRLVMLTRLKQHYRTFLLSNTNSIHAARFEPLFVRPDGVGDIHFFFEKVFYSHQLHLSKPAPEIFNKVVYLAEIIPEQTLYVDDAIENIAAAKKLGFYTLHIESGMEVAEEIQKVLSL